MNKIFVDDIKKRGDLSLPGPGKYETKNKFGKDGLTYTIASKFLIEKLALEKSTKLPGPGSYKHTEVLGKPLILSHY